MQCTRLNHTRVEAYFGGAPHRVRITPGATGFSGARWGAHTDLKFEVRGAIKIRNSRTTPRTEILDPKY